MQKDLNHTPNLERVRRLSSLKEKELLGLKQNSDKEKRDKILRKSLKDRFVNHIMEDGKRFKAIELISLTLCRIRQRQNQTSFKSLKAFKDGTEGVLTEAIRNVKPAVEVRKIKKSGKTHLIPSIPFEKRKQSLAIRWIIEAARNRQKTRNLGFADSLAEEILDAFQEKGKARERRDKLYLIAQNNRGNLRFRWW